MAESSLSLTKAQLESRIGDWLGFGFGPLQGDAEWDDRQTAIIRQTVDDGLRQFYYPPIVDPDTSQWNWSFLRPVASLTLVEGESTVDLPDDYGSTEGPITITSSPASIRPGILLCGEAKVRQAYVDSPEETGCPLLIAEVPLRPTTGVHGQRKQFSVFPIADQDYTLALAYYVNPDTITTVNPYPYGGAQHSGAVLASCLAAAEVYRDNTRGPMYATFIERLRASIGVDRRNKPMTMGLNRDNSDGPDWSPRWNHWLNSPPVTYNGNPMEQ